MRHVARLLPLVLAAILGALAVSGGGSCKTNEAGELVPDWEAWDEELDALVDDLLDFKAAHPEHAEEYDDAIEAVVLADAVAEALAAGGEVDLEKARGQVALAIALLEPFVDEEWALIGRAVLRRVKNHLTD